MSTSQVPFSRSYLHSAAALSVVFVALSLVAYLGLAAVFEFPDILRRPAAEILAVFSANEPAVRGFYYLFAIAHLVLAAAVLLVRRALEPAGGPWLTVATGGGVLYAVAQTAGFLRWPMLVPMFAAHMAGGDLSPDEERQTLLLLEAFHRYAGVAIGENLSFWGFGAWLLGIGVTLGRPHIDQRRVGALWITAGVLVLVYTFEQLGGPFAMLAPLLIVSHGLAYGLILALSVSFLRAGEEDARPGAVGVVPASLIAAFCLAMVVPGLLP